MTSYQWIITNFCPISHCFQVIVTYLSNHCFWQQLLYLTPSFGVNPWTLDCKIWPKRLKISPFHVVHNTFRYIELIRCEVLVWQMDRIEIAISKILSWKQLQHNEWQMRLKWRKTSRYRPVDRDCSWCLFQTRVQCCRKLTGQNRETSAVGWVTWPHIGWLGYTACWRGRCSHTPLLGYHCNLQTTQIIHSSKSNHQQQ